MMALRSLPLQHGSELDGAASGVTDRWEVPQEGIAQQDQPRVNHTSSRLQGQGPASAQHPEPSKARRMHTLLAAPWFNWSISPCACWDVGFCFLTGQK